MLYYDEIRAPHPQTPRSCQEAAVFDSCRRSQLGKPHLPHPPSKGNCRRFHGMSPVQPVVPGPARFGSALLSPWDGGGGAPPPLSLSLSLPPLCCRTPETGSEKRAAVHLHGGGCGGGCFTPQQGSWQCQKGDSGSALWGYKICNPPPHQAAWGRLCSARIGRTARGCISEQGGCGVGWDSEAEGPSQVAQKLNW